MRAAIAAIVGVVLGYGAIQPPPRNSAPQGVISTGACTDPVLGDVVCRDNQADSGGVRTTDTAPNGVGYRPQPAYRYGTQTESNIVIAGGMQELIYTVTTAANCGTDAMTTKITDRNGTVTTCTCTEGTGWTKTDGNNNATATSLATCITACSGIDADTSSAVVGIIPLQSTMMISVATSDATCTTVPTLTRGNVIINAKAMCLPDQAGAAGSCLAYATTNNMQLVDSTGSAANQILQSNAFLTTGTGAATFYTTANGGGFGTGSGSQYLFSSTTSGLSSHDVGIKRAAAGILAFTNGSSGNASGFVPGTLTQGTLGTPANGTMVYCSDCTIANPCAAAGTGAFAKRLNGVWVCN